MLSRRLLRIKAIKSLYAHFKSESDSLIVAEKSLLFNISKCYELYHLLLWLIVDVANEADAAIDRGRRKHLATEQEKNPNLKFTENRVIDRLRRSDALTTYLTDRKLSWSSHPDLVKRLYKSMIESDYYKAYMEAPTRSFKEDVKLIVNFYCQSVDSCELLEEVVEELSIYWADDIDFANIMVVRTLRDMKASKEDFELLPMYKEEEDREFVKELFRRTIVSHKEYFELVDAHTKNWDVERIAFMDNLIMATCIAELVSFPSIPVKVTMDEFIEISKYYSTPGSSLFINGVMDKISKTLAEQGRIQKVGRGLL